MHCDDLHPLPGGLDLLTHLYVVLALVHPSGVVVAWEVIQTVIP